MELYCDYSATTPILPEVLVTMMPYLINEYGNPSSLYIIGRKARVAVEESRQTIANILNCKPKEIIFTSGGTEGDNWVVKGTAIEKRPYGRHIITSSVEHPAVLNSLHQLEKLGYDVTYLPVDENGRVSAEDLKAAIRKDTILVSIMAVNNEVGAIQPLKEIAAVLEDFPKIHFHVDAVQGVGKGIQELLEQDRVDFLTFSGHKFHAPRGIGFMYKKRGRMIAPLMSGGGQEKALRSGTENLPAIASMAKALRLTLENEGKKVAQQKAIKEKIYNHISKRSKVTVFSKLNDEFAPHILCFAISGVRGETIVHAFENYDIYISTTSACSSKKGITSGTLTAMKIPDNIATSAVRVSLDEKNTLAEADKFIEIFDVLYEKFKKINS